VAVPPLDITVRVWLDRDPEVMTGGLAPWIAQAALVRAEEFLSEGVEPSEEEEVDDGDV